MAKSTVVQAGRCICSFWTPLLPLFPAPKSTAACPGPTMAEPRQWRWRLNAPDRQRLSSQAAPCFSHETAWQHSRKALHDSQSQWPLKHPPDCFLSPYDGHLWKWVYRRQTHFGNDVGFLLESRRTAAFIRDNWRSRSPSLANGFFQVKLWLVDWVEAHRPELTLLKLYYSGSSNDPSFVVSASMSIIIFLSSNWEIIKRIFLSSILYDCIL